MFKKTYLLLNRKNKIGLLKVILFLSLGIILEFVGLGLLYPFLNLIQGNESVNSILTPFSPIFQTFLCKIQSFQGV